MFKKFYLLSLCSVVVSCHYFKRSEDEKVLARVGDSYLYTKDLEGLVAEGTSKEDSTLMVNSFITRWATQLLMVDGANRNLPEETTTRFNSLVNQYRNDLLTKAYLEALVKKNIDSTITDEEALSIYETNKETFRLNVELMKFRYIHISEHTIDRDGITKRFKRFNKEDKRHLDSIAMQFVSYSLNDSVWIKVDQAIDKIPVLNADNKKELLKKSNFIQLKDSLGLYLMQINDVLKPNDDAPLEYVRPTVTQIIINRRKLELIKQLEIDITKDAIKNNQFEIYN